MAPQPQRELIGGISALAASMIALNMTEGGLPPFSSKKSHNQIKSLKDILLNDRELLKATIKQRLVVDHNQVIFEIGLEGKN